MRLDVDESDWELLFLLSMATILVRIQEELYFLSSATFSSNIVLIKSRIHKT